MTPINAVRYIAKNSLMFLKSRNSCVITKKKAVTYHNLETKYLSETSGISLVIVVTPIHVRLMIIASVMGWFAIPLSNFCSANSFRIKMSRTPNNKGSVGMVSPTPKPISLRLIESGVRKTIKSISLSKAKNAKSMTNKRTGRIGA